MLLINDNHVGKLARKRRGFFDGIVGKIVKTDFGYALEFSDGSMTTVNSDRDVDFVEEVVTHD